MKFRRKHPKASFDIGKNANMALAKFSSEMRVFLALGSLCAASASLAGVEQKKLDWLSKNLSDFKSLENYQFTVAEAVVTLLPLLQEQLSVRISPRLMRLIEQAEISHEERVVLYHEIGLFFLESKDQRHAGEYFLKAQGKMTKSKKLLAEVAKRSVPGKHHLSWPVSKAEPEYIRLDRAKECGMAARYYLETAGKLSNRQDRKMGLMLDKLCHKLEHRISHYH